MNERSGFIHELQGRAIRASRTVMAWMRGDGRKAVSGYVLTLGIAIFMALIGAMDTDQAPWGKRLIFWIMICFAGMTIASLIEVALNRFGKAFPTNPILAWAVLTIPISILLTPVIYVVVGVIFGFGPIRYMWNLSEGSFVVTGGITAFMLLVHREPMTVTHRAPGNPDSTVRPAAFLDRFPEKLQGATLYAVSSEGHYLRLWTDRGSDLILMRLADAVRELEGVEGAQVHRSWWVARDAVTGSRREGSRLLLTLPEGTEAPVSRPNVKPLKEAGWV